MRTHHHAVQADGSATTMVIVRAARDLIDGEALLRFEPAPDQDSDRGNAIRLWLGRPPAHTHTHTHASTFADGHALPMNDKHSDDARPHTEVHLHCQEFVFKN